MARVTPAVRHGVLQHARPHELGRGWALLALAVRGELGVRARHRLRAPNGEIDIPYPPGDPRNTEFANKNVLLGSRDLFRDTLAIERSFGSAFAIQIFYEHLSHGQILGQGRNQGMDELGLRGVIRFGGPD
jgi:hypothetical protein